MGHPGVDKISFTGGAATARTLMATAAANLTPLALELGGKSPNIVFPDADLDGAASVAAQVGTGLLSGQGCALPTRLYVHDDVYEQVVAEVVAALDSLAVGDPLDPATFVGPVVTEAAMERILGGIERARSDGATLLAGGTRLGGELADGWFVAPTVFGDVDHQSDLARHEVFGPVQAILRFRSDDEVLAQANDSPFGLGRLPAHPRPGAHRSASSGSSRPVRWRSTGWVDLPGHPVRGLQAERLRARGRSGRHRGDGAAQDGVRRPLGIRSGAENTLVTSHPMCL